MSVTTTINVFCQPSPMIGNMCCPGGSSGGGVPFDAILDENAQPVLDENNNFIQAD